MLVNYAAAARLSPGIGAQDVPAVTICFPFVLTQMSFTLLSWVRSDPEALNVTCFPCFPEYTFDPNAQHHINGGGHCHKPPF